MFIPLSFLGQIGTFSGCTISVFIDLKWRKGGSLSFSCVNVIKLRGLLKEKANQRYSVNEQSCVLNKADLGDLLRRYFCTSGLLVL